jgi:hypothetical protein
MSEDEGVEWACRSIDLAIACGAEACSVIPTRGGNGAMDVLAPPFVPPGLAALERVIEYGLARGGCRVFADLWDVERLAACQCSAARVSRLRAMNRDQQPTARVVCECDGRR